MKTARLPRIHVEPEFLGELKSLLSEGETISSFVRQAVERALNARKVQQDFDRRAAASLEEYQRTALNDSTEKTTGIVEAATSGGEASGSTPQEGPSYLFLDIDGVLHPIQAEDDELLTQLPLFEDWLRRRPGIEVVISSSWRHSHSLEQLKGLFAPDLRDQVVGVTDLYWRWVYEETGEAPLTTAHERELEVLRWLELHGAKGAAWVALDDMPGQFNRTLNHVVACEPRVGLTEHLLVEVERVLQAQQTSPDL